LTVSDGQLSDSITKGVNVLTEPEELEITELVCFDEVVVNHNQACSVTVVEDNGIEVPNVDVEIFYENGDLFGACNTGNNGRCTASLLQTQLGTFTVYATANKQGLDGDNDHEPTFTYDVVNESDHHFISDLMVFNDAAFTQEDYDFFRGEDMFVRFAVTDEFGVALNLTTLTHLVSSGGGRIELTSLMPFDGTYYYFTLSPIPLDHSFIGPSEVFTFAFETGSLVDQDEVDVLIRNNPPVLSGIPDIETNTTFTMDLAPYGTDLEDPNDLAWSLSGSMNHFNADLQGSVLTIVPTSVGEEFLTITVTDLDGDSASQQITVRITGIDDINITDD
ncbi:hypothetical protein KY339_03115, partial [Candidatus Woesearchaeota archaeon]|nr:hypothetical protein [Candidatus Woesearchaeota archaeon]